jgi:hypothetical protein
MRTAIELAPLLTCHVPTPKERFRGYSVSLEARKERKNCHECSVVRVSPNGLVARPEIDGTTSPGSFTQILDGMLPWIGRREQTSPPPRWNKANFTNSSNFPLESTKLQIHPSARCYAEIRKIRVPRRIHISRRTYQPPSNQHRRKHTPLPSLLAKMEASSSCALP